ncbi:hypothetical protein GQ457_05G017100 [Hibiscus cannabinus]
MEIKQNKANPILQCFSFTHSIGEGSPLQALTDSVPSPTFSASFIGDVTSTVMEVRERGHEQRLPTTLFKT